METESLTLKWGTLKGWDNISPENLELLKKYLEDSPASCMFDRPDDERKAILCQLIDNINGEIWNDWEGTKMTKAEAKEYILNYRKQAA